MGSPLGPVLAGIFIVELETRIVSTLANMVFNWKGFADDTVGYVKNGSIGIFLSKLNSFYFNIQFTYEVEEENKLPFLDVLLIRNGNFIETKVYRKPTNNDIYLNWNLFAANTLFNLFILKTPCRSIKHLEYVFEKYSTFPNG